MSKHEKQSRTLVGRIKKAREGIKTAARKFFQSPAVEHTLELMKAQKELETVFFRFGVHWAEYACDCYKQVMSVKP